MLVLSRKVGEAVQVGASLVRVLEVKGDRVRLGFEADPAIGIWRAEVLLDEAEPIGDAVEV